MLSFAHIFKKENKPKKDCLLVLDIGTEFVKALVLEIDKIHSEQNENKSQGHVIGVVKVRQKPNNMLAGAVADIDGVISICQRAVKEAIEQTRVAPKTAIMGVAGEFVKGVSTGFVYQRINPQKEIDLVELQNIIQKIQWRAFDRTRKQLAWETGRREVEIKPINALLTDIRVDGYQVTNPLSFQGKEVFFNIFNVYAPIVHLQALEKIASQLNLNLLSIVADSYALARCANFDSREGAIFIDIGGGSTDIALVRQGRVEGIKSLSLAGRAFTKRIALLLGLDLKEAEGLKLKHSRGDVSRDVQDKVGTILEKDAEIWRDGLELILEDFSSDKPLPSMIFLCGGGSLLPNIKDVLNRQDIQRRWLGKFSFQQFPEVKFIKTSQICNVFDETNGRKDASIITPYALAGLGVEMTLDQQQVMPPILRRAVRMMR